MGLEDQTWKAFTQYLKPDYISRFQEVAAKYREVIPVSIKDYVNLERFAA